VTYSLIPVRRKEVVRHICEGRLEGVLAGARRKRPERLQPLAFAEDPRRPGRAGRVPQLIVRGSGVERAFADLDPH